MGRQEKLNKSIDELFPQQSSDSCRVCNEEVVNGRWNYCSERCREIAQAVQKKFTWGAVREKTLTRDEYTCQECGLTKEMWERAYWQVQEIVNETVEPIQEENGPWRTRKDQLMGRYGVEFPEFHVDHIQRVADDGHPLAEENLQTLCKHCHQEKTASENREESIEQRPEIGLDEYM